MSNKNTIRDFLDQSKSKWVTAKTCEVGDIMEIKSKPELDTTSFQGKTYLVMDVLLERTKEELKLRLGSASVSNLVPSLTDVAEKWIGRKIKVAGKTMYAGLGKEGLIIIPSA